MILVLIFLLLAWQSYNVGYDMTKLMALLNLLVANDYHGCIQNSIPKTS